MPKFLITGPSNAQVRFLCAHGAGGGMVSPFLDMIAKLLAERGIAVWRFEFAYMAARREGGTRKPPPKAERVMDEYRAAVSEMPRDGTAIIGGKSMGGRVASMVADDLFKDGRIAGLTCLGFPDAFVEQGDQGQLRSSYGLDAAGIADRVRRSLAAARAAEIAEAGDDDVAELAGAAAE